jgi:hypothetical protein
VLGTPLRDDEQACDELRSFIILVHGEHIERAFGTLYEAAINLHGSGLQTAIAILSGFYGEYTCWQRGANLLRSRAAASAASPVDWDEVRKMPQ